MVGLTELGEFAWRRREDPQPAARGGAPGHGGGAAHDRDGRVVVPRLGGGAQRASVASRPIRARCTRRSAASRRELPGHESVLPAPAPASAEPAITLVAPPVAARPWPPTSRSTSTSSTRCSTRFRSKPPRRTCGRRPIRRGTTCPPPIRSPSPSWAMPGSGTSVEVEILGVGEAARGGGADDRACVASMRPPRRSPRRKESRSTSCRRSRRRTRRHRRSSWCPTTPAASC